MGTGFGLVGGSAHCVLAPYRRERLDRNLFQERQISSRGGALRCELHGERMAIGGEARLYLEGQMTIPT